VFHNGKEITPEFLDRPLIADGSNIQMVPQLDISLQVLTLWVSVFV
jgi:hypothetical protein